MIDVNTLVTLAGFAITIITVIVSISWKIGTMRSDLDKRLTIVETNLKIFFKLEEKYERRINTTSK